MKRFFDGISYGTALFLMFYFFIYAFPFPLEWLPFQIGESISSSVDKFWQWLVVALIKDGGGYNGAIDIRVNGSGDTSYHYFKVLIQGIISFLLVIISLVFLKERKIFEKLRMFFGVYIRYYLVVTMMIYGFAKVFPNQFWGPGLTDLLKPFGEISPMGLLWKFMGYSVPYIMFTGIMEVLSGLFLLFRKTTRLGALLVFGIMLNVFILNMSYDVPVKLFSFHLVLLSVLILSKDLIAFLNFFILNKPVVPITIDPYFKKKKHIKLGYLSKAIIILFISYVIITNNYNNQWSHGRKMTLPHLYGIYEVNTFIINQDTIVPLLTDENRWKRLIVDKYSTTITKMNGDVLYASSEVDTINSTIKITPFKEPSTFNFQYKLNKTNLLFNGHQGKDTLQISFEVKDASDFYLIKRGFHWINEYPNNR